MKKFQLPLAAVALAAVASACGGGKGSDSVPTDDDVILHAWSWSFDTIAANMADIAAAGYSYVQTSPANTCFVGEDGGMALFSAEGDSVKGKWYYYYQPIDWKVGNHLLGTREQFKAMCDSAAKYGVRVIVDVLPNHTAFDHTAVLPALDSAAGGHDHLFHANGFTTVSDYNDRLQCTTYAMGGLPDVNTENPGFQHYYMQYVNDLLALGARGFRYDTAKHIGLPSDPLDSLSARNNFWPVALGLEEVQGLRMSMPSDSLFIYGEVLQDKNVKEDEYAALMRVTASDYGHAIRKALADGNAKGVDLASFHHKASPDRLVTWVESHDTYANEHESAGLTDAQIRAGYVFLAARQHGFPLFFSRPAGSTRDNYWGNNRIGAKGNGEFMHPAVVAVNKFRKAMHGNPESLYISEDGTMAVVSRADKGLALVNFSDSQQDVDLPVQLPDGEYTDHASGAKFTVESGHLIGFAEPTGTYILY